MVGFDMALARLAGGGLAGFGLAGCGLVGWAGLDVAWLGCGLVWVGLTSLVGSCLGGARLS